MSVQIDGLPPVPQHTAPLDGPGGTEVTRKTPFSVTWMSWFLQLKFKVDTINAVIVNLAGLTGTGIPVKTSATAWALRSIAGTTNYITVTNGDGVLGNPTIDISINYPGQASIVTVGTIATGTWQASVVASTYGGTGFSTYAAGDMIYASATNTLAKKAIGTNGYVWTVVAGLPAWAPAAGGGGAGSTYVDSVYNLTLATSRSAGAETIAIKTAAGTDPSVTDTIAISFRNATAATGDYTTLTINAALSLTINSGATLGSDKAATATVTIASPGVITYSNHRMRPDDGFVFSTTGALPTGITAGTTYYVSATGFTFSTFQFSTTVGGASVNTSGSQSGVHTLTWVPKPFRVWIVIANDGGTPRLGAIKCAVGSTSIYPLQDNVLVSSTAIGAGSDSAAVFYSGIAWTTKALRVIGYLDYTLTVAGTWDAAPTFAQIWGKGMRLPGNVIQMNYNDTPTATSGSTTVPFDTSTPQSTEGDQYFTSSFTATSLANMLAFDFQGVFENTNANNMVAFLLKDSEVNAYNVTAQLLSAADRAFNVGFRFCQQAQTVSAASYKIRAGSNNAATQRINSNGGAAATYGGAPMSSLTITERMV